MGRRLLPLVLCGLLAGCASVRDEVAEAGERAESLLRAGSGVVEDAASVIGSAVEMGKLGAEAARKQADELQKRAESLAGGVEKLGEAAVLIKEGIGGDEQ